MQMFKHGNKKVEMFKDGILKKEFLNPDYRGSWLIQVMTSEGDKYNDTAGLLLATFNGQFHTTLLKCNEVTDIEVREFTTEDIPEGEIVWIKGAGAYNWTKKFWTLPKQKIEHYLQRNSVVPSLVAADAVQAEKMCGWWK